MYVKDLFDADSSFAWTSDQGCNHFHSTLKTNKHVSLELLIVQGMQLTSKLLQV